MPCSHCIGAEDVFGQQMAYRDLKEYTQNGPATTTQRLLEVLRGLGVEGATLIDIGGGVGVIQHELMAAGLAHSTDVDASSAYIRVAKEEAEKRGYADRAEYHHGDFVDLAPNLAQADIVTLDRAICCYPDVRALVTASAQKATRIYAAVFPRDAWWMRLGTPLLNVMFRWRNNPFRVFIHDQRLVHDLITAQGWDKHAHHMGWFWQVVVYTRP